MTQTTTTASLMRRTLSARWADLSDRAQKRAIESGRARRAEVTVSLESAEAWRDDWRDDRRDDTGGSWPTYTLSVEVDGEEYGAVDGWHFVGPWSGYQSSDWTTRDDDGATHGLPRCDTDADGTITIGGAEGQDSLVLPLVADDGAVLIYDTLDIDAAIRDAANGADHGDAPGMEDLDDLHSRMWSVASTLYVVRKCEVEEVEIEWAGCWWDGKDGGYLVVGYRVEEKIFETEAEARKSIEGDDGERYADEDAAKEALAATVDDRLGELDDLPGMTHGRDDDGLYVEPDGAEDEESRYHLDESQAALVCQVGWLSILDDVVEALGRRATLDAQRSWQAEMDRVIAATDPLVGIDDSTAGGNCPAGTRSFRDQLAPVVGADGEIGAVRASVILAHRDDAYTRRACRMAAHRMTRRA